MELTRPLALLFFSAACGPGPGSDTGVDTGSTTASTGSTTASTATSAITSGAADVSTTLDPGATSSSSTDSSTTGSSTTDASTSGSTAADSTTPGSTTASATGDTGPTSGCHDDTDCAPDFCMVPADPACDECRPALPTCVVDVECAPGNVCIEIPVPCPCDAPFETICSPPCQTAADCDDQACDDTGHCFSGDPCDVDDDCPPLLHCADLPGQDACRPRFCEQDAACPGGLCIDGRCHEAPGACVPSAF